MTEKERLKSERKEYFKNATLKQKFVYFWEYYKIQTFIILCLAIAVSYCIFHLVTAKDTALSGIFLNAASLENDNNSTELAQEFIELQKIDTSKYDINFNKSYTLTGDETTDYEVDQAIWVQINAGAVDFMVSPLDYVTDYAYRDYYYDLRTILSEEQIKKYEPYFLYVDREVLNEVAELTPELDNKTVIEYPDFTKSEEMKDPIPVLIDLSQCEKITNLYSSDSDLLVFGILGNSQNLDMTLEFLDYLME